MSPFTPNIGKLCHRAILVLFLGLRFEEEVIWLFVAIDTCFVVSKYLRRNINGRP
jgi:hypothetical protein